LPTSRLGQLQRAKRTRKKREEIFRQTRGGGKKGRIHARAEGEKKGQDYVLTRTREKLSRGEVEADKHAALTTTT